MMIIYLRQVGEARQSSHEHILRLYLDGGVTTVDQLAEQQSRRRLKSEKSKNS